MRSHENSTCFVPHILYVAVYSSCLLWDKIFISLAFWFLVFFFRTGANRFKDVWETGVFPFNQTMRLKIVHVIYHDLQVVLREIEPVQNVRLINQKYLQQQIKCFTTIGCPHSETLQTDERHAA